MLENVSDMIHMAATEHRVFKDETLKARQKTEILTLKPIVHLVTKASAILELSPIPPLQTATLTSIPAILPSPPPLTQSTVKTPIKSLISRKTTLASTSARSSSLAIATATATYLSISAKNTFLKVKEILVNLSETIGRNAKHSKSCSNNKSNNNKIKTNKGKKYKKVITNENVNRHMIQQNNMKEFHHLLSLNRKSFTNVLQHEQLQQQKRNESQYHCSNKYLYSRQQHKVKQLLLLLTCFVAIITISSLPHSTIAAATATVAPTIPAPATLYMSTTYKMSPTPTIKTVKSLTTNKTQEKIMLHISSPLTIYSSTDNESKKSDNKKSSNNSTNLSSSNKNKIADDNITSNNVDDLTSPSPLERTVGSPFANFGSKNSKNTTSTDSTGISKHYPFEIKIISRFIRSIDGSSISLGSSSISSSESGISSFFSPLPGGVSSSGLTNIFNQNLDTGLSSNIECPSFDESSACPCYKFEDGLFLECPGTTATSLRTTLERISSPIHSLSIYDFDRSVTSLSQDVFQPGVNIRHLQFSHSHLETLKENSLKNVRASLESLSIVNGKLTQTNATISVGMWLPRKAVSSVHDNVWISILVGIYAVCIKNKGSPKIPPLDFRL